MLARIHVHGGAKTKKLDLKLPTILGRGGASNVKLPASTVSRQHCEIYEYEGQVAIRDLGSANGTLVNGHRIAGPTFVGPEDWIQVGPLVFTIEARAADSATPRITPPVVTEPTQGNAATQGNSAKEPAEPLGTEAQAADGSAAPPSFEELPPALGQPVLAEVSAVEPESVSPDPPSPVPSSDESVLQYTAPKDDGERSFVGIETGDDAANPESVQDTPVLGEVEEKPNVGADESALQNFFKNLE